MPVMRREFALVLLLGAAGAGLVVLAVRQAWAQAIFSPPRPLPTQDFSVTGQALVPLAGALALAALACLAAVIATRSVTRRAVGALRGSTTGGTSSGGAAHAIVIAGSSGRAVLAGAPWRAAAVAGAVAIVLAGLATVWRGPRWPVMSSRFERPQRVPPGQHSTDSAALWESLSRDVDPTVDGGTRH